MEYVCISILSRSILPTLCQVHSTLRCLYATYGRAEINVIGNSDTVGPRQVHMYGAHTTRGTRGTATTHTYGVHTYIKHVKHPRSSQVQQMAVSTPLTASTSTSTYGAAEIHWTEKFEGATALVGRGKLTHT